MSLCTHGNYQDDCTICADDTKQVVEHLKSECVKLAGRIDSHIRQLSPHQSERDTALWLKRGSAALKLLAEKESELSTLRAERDELRDGCNFLHAKNQRLDIALNALQARIADSEKQEPVLPTGKTYGLNGLRVFHSMHDVLYTHPFIPPAGMMLVPVSVLENATSSIGAFCGDEGWGQDDMDNMDAVDAELAKYYARIKAAPSKVE
jgi:hypothetical protein